MINIEKDTIRYQSALKEFNKLSFNSFVHLKATYWKEKNNFIKVNISLSISLMYYFMLLSSAWGHNLRTSTIYA